MLLHLIGQALCRDIQQSNRDVFGCLFQSVIEVQQFSTKCTQPKCSAIRNENFTRTLYTHLTLPVAPSINQSIKQMSQSTMAIGFCVECHHKIEMSTREFVLLELPIYLIIDLSFSTTVPTVKVPINLTFVKKDREWKLIDHDQVNSCDDLQTLREYTLHSVIEREKQNHYTNDIFASDCKKMMHYDDHMTKFMKKTQSLSTSYGPMLEYKHLYYPKC